MRKEFQLTQEQLTKILEASKPTRYMVIGGIVPRSPQENANSAWEALGKELGFKAYTVKPVPGKPDCFFSAEAIETEAQGSFDFPDKV